jgi:hypothetical protein
MEIQRAQGGGDHGFGGNAIHATEIYGAFAPETGGAGHAGGAHDLGGGGPDRPGHFRRGAAEGNDDRRADGGGQVHGAGVIGQEQLAGGEGGRQFAQRGLAGQVDGGLAGELPAQAGANGPGDFEIGRPAKKRSSGSR